MHLRTIILCALLLACQATHAQEPIYNHLYWDAKGTRGNQLLGMSGLSYLGKLSDAVPHAVAIGEFEKARLIFNQGIRDTTPQYYFPGNKVWRCSMNGDSFPDFVCWNGAQHKITVLFGTHDPVKFDTALVLNGGGPEDYFHYLDGKILVGDFDSSGYDGLLVVDMFQSSIHGDCAARTLWYKGGVKLDTTPSSVWIHNCAANQIAMGRIRDTTHWFICEMTKRGDSATVSLYPIGKNFSAKPSDSLVCTLDVSRYCCIGGSFTIADCDGDKVDDILLDARDTDYLPNLKVDPVVVVYKGGVDSALPRYYFHRPFETNSVLYGRSVLLGDITGRGYLTLLITDPDASLGNQENGAIFLYNIGKGLEDKCVGYARGNEFEGKFGTSAIAIGDVNNDSKNDFMVGGNADGISINVGYVGVFLGDTIYGPTTAVREIGVTPSVISLAQNYPNPCSASSIVTFDIVGEREVQLNVYDAIGKIVATPVSGNMSTGRYAAGINVQNLPSGVYRYDLTDGNSHVSRFMTIIK